MHSFFGAIFALAVCVAGCSSTEERHLPLELDVNELNPDANDGGDTYDRGRADSSTNLMVDLGMVTDARVEIDGAQDPCAPECSTDDDCQAGYTCQAMEDQSCNRARLQCVDACVDNPRNSRPEDLRCCRDDRSLAPLCRLGEWMCPEDTQVVRSSVEYCGPSENTPEVGVVCDAGNGQTLCEGEDYCCRWLNPTCTSDREATCYQRIFCDGPEDCAGDDICCASPEGRFEGSACRPPEACGRASQYRLCNVDGDCPDTQECCAATLQFSSAICLNTCHGESP